MGRHTDRTHMEGRKAMDWQAIWYVLAGFVLGFATSTLWEWLYYRRQRLLARAGEVDAGDYTLVPAAEQPAAPRSSTAEYRSPGVFLESERPEPAGNDAEPQRAAWEAPRFVERGRRDEDTGGAFVPARSQEERYFEAPRGFADEFKQDLEEEPEEDLEEEGEHERAQGRLPGSRAAPQVVPITVAPPGLRRQPAPEDEPVQPEPDAAPPATTADVRAAEPSPAPRDGPPAGAEPAQTPAVEDRTDSAAPKYAAIAPQPPERPDNFAKIKGVGSVYRQRLYEAGISTWQQLVDTDPEVLRKITRAKPNADIEEWQAQAQALMEKYRREGATYHGPPPDDLTAISGIGPTTLDALYHAGICTFEQLAAATPDQLRDLLPAPAVGVEANYTPWIEQAKRLANHHQKAP
jgi:predicted flap endonuclease-1-like 5' DNA nuclease